MTVITYKDHCRSVLKPYEVIIYTDDGNVLYHGKTESVVLEGTQDLSKIKGGKGEPITYQIDAEEGRISLEEPNDIPWKVIGCDLSNRS